MATATDHPLRTDLRFRKARADRREVTAADYTQAVWELIQTNGEARVKDLADMMGVSHVTVSRVVNRLMEKGYLLTEPYRPIMLTERGKRLASEAKRRHDIAIEFLLALGVPSEAAELDGEGIKHHLSEETLVVMQRFAEERRG